MADKTYTPTAGLRNVGSYQVSGTPFVRAATATSGDTIRIQFPSVTRNVSIQLDSSAGGQIDNGSYKVTNSDGGAVTQGQAWTTNGKEFSISFWAKVNAALSYSTIVGLAVSPAGQNEGRWSLRIQGGAYKMRFRTADGNLVNADWTPSFTSTDWNFYTLVQTKNQLSLHMNGNTTPEKTITANPGEVIDTGNLVRYLQIGDPNNTNESAQINIIDLVVWDRALKDADITAIYNSGTEYDYKIALLNRDYPSSSFSFADGTAYTRTFPSTRAGSPSEGASYSDQYTYTSGDKGWRFMAPKSDSTVQIRLPAGWKHNGVTLTEYKDINIRLTGQTATPVAAPTYDDMLVRVWTGEAGENSPITPLDSAINFTDAINGLGTTDQYNVNATTMPGGIAEGLPGFSASVSPNIQGGVDMWVAEDQDQSLAQYLRIRTPYSDDRGAFMTSNAVANMPYSSDDGSPIDGCYEITATGSAGPPSTANRGGTMTQGKLWLTNGREFTVSFWAKCTSRDLVWPDMRTMVGFAALTNGASEGKWRFRVYGSSGEDYSMRGRAFDAATDSYAHPAYGTNFNIPGSNWHEWQFYTIVQSAAAVDIYINGIHKINRAYDPGKTIASSECSYLTIGDAYNQNPETAPQQIRNVVVWDRALIEADITAIFAKHNNVDYETPLPVRTSYPSSSFVYSRDGSYQRTFGTKTDEASQAIGDQYAYTGGNKGFSVVNGQNNSQFQIRLPQGWKQNGSTLSEFKDITLQQVNTLPGSDPTDEVDMVIKLESSAADSAKNLVDAINGLGTTAQYKVNATTMPGGITEGIPGLSASMSPNTEGGVDTWVSSEQDSSLAQYLRMRALTSDAVTGWTDLVAGTTQGTMPTGSDSVSPYSTLFGSSSYQTIDTTNAGGMAQASLWPDGSTMGTEMTVTWWGMLSSSNWAGDANTVLGAEEPVIVGFSEDKTSEATVYLKTQTAAGNGKFVFQGAVQQFSASNAGSAFAGTETFPAATSSNGYNQTNWRFYALRLSRTTPTLYQSNDAGGMDEITWNDTAWSIPAGNWMHNTKYSYLSFGDPFASTSDKSPEYRFRDMVVWDRALTAGDITTVYNSGDEYDYTQMLATNNAYGKWCFATAPCADPNARGIIFSGVTNTGYLDIANYHGSWPFVGTLSRFRAMTGMPSYRPGGGGGTATDDTFFLIGNAGGGNGYPQTAAINFCHMINGTGDGTVAKYGTDFDVFHAGGDPGWSGLTASLSKTVEYGVDLSIDKGLAGYSSTKIRSPYGDASLSYFGINASCIPLSPTYNFWFNDTYGDRRAQKCLHWKMDDGTGDTTSIIDNEATNVTSSVAFASASIRHPAKGLYPIDNKSFNWDWALDDVNAQKLIWYDCNRNSGDTTSILYNNSTEPRAITGSCATFPNASASIPVPDDGRFYIATPTGSALDKEKWNWNWTLDNVNAQKLIWYNFDTNATSDGWPDDTTSKLWNRSIERRAILNNNPDFPNASASMPNPAYGEYETEVPSGYPAASDAGGGAIYMGLKHTGSYPGVITNKHYWKLENKNDKLTMNIKTKEIYLSAVGGDCSYSVQADLTTIPTGSMFDLTGSGIDS